MRDLLQALIEVAGLRVEVRVDPARLRPSDVPELVGDPARIRDEVGWSPQLPLRRTLADLMQYWRERVAQTEPAAGPGR
jgi:GDP-4-dehydro-6-deoxy-D-mannose reductase